MSSKTNETELYFTDINLHKSYPVLSNAQEKTKYSIDKSYLLSTLSKTLTMKHFLIAELQLSFLLFLIGNVYDGFCTWKNLICLFCQCEEQLTKDIKFMTIFISD